MEHGMPQPRVWMIPEADGLWTYFPNGYWRMGYRIDEASRQILADRFHEQRNALLAVAVAIAPTAFGISKVLARLMPTTFGGADILDVADIWMALWMMVIAVLATFWHRGTMDVLKARSLGTVVLSSR